MKSLAPHLTEQLFAIGAGHRVVATTDFADYPEAARSLPRVARAHNVDLARVAAARPDLIVVWGSGFPPATVAALRRLGAPVFVDEPTSLDGIAASMLRLGQLTSADGAADAAARYRAAIDGLRSRYSSLAEVSVFYQVWPQPLMTLGGRHVLSEGLRACGARNVFERLTPIAPQGVDVPHARFRIRARTALWRAGALDIHCGELQDVEQRLEKCADLRLG